MPARGVRPMRARPGRRGRVAFLAVASFVAGAAVMTLEVVGARVIGAYFGVSLFVWTSLIAVTLLALAIGYAAGGRSADAHRDADPVFLWLGAAGLLVLGVPWVKDAVLVAVVPLGPRWGAFAAALALFGPPLALLGAASPAIVRQLADDPGRLAATVGWLAGLSTLGSLFGTLLSGYVLLVHFDLAQILAGAGGACLALAAAWFALAAGRPVALAALLLPALALPAPREARAVLADGTVATLADARSGFYGDVRIVDYAFGTRRTREMLIDGLVQGGMDVATGQSVYETVPLLERLPLAHRPGAARALVVGLGPGLVATGLARRGLRVEAVEIDPAVVDAARRHFAFPAAIPVVVDDARHAIARGAGLYDVVVLDVFNGDTTPSHLLTRQSLASVRGRLVAGGVVALNLIVSASAAASGKSPVLATLAEVFPHVRIYPVGDASGDGPRNVIAIASAEALAPVATAPDWLSAVHPMAQEGVARALASATAWRTAPGVRVLTDEYNPVDVQDAAVKDAMRRSIQRAMSPDLLLGRPAR